MTRFFKAYFIGSLIYAVWFGVLMYAVDPMLAQWDATCSRAIICVFRMAIRGRFPISFILSCPFRYSAFCTLPSLNDANAAWSG